jgi:hypothetical protein
MGKGGAGQDTVEVYIRDTQRFSNCGERPLGGAVGPLGGGVARVGYMRHIYFK